MYLAPGAVNQQIHALETLFGAKLFNYHAVGGIDRKGLRMLPDSGSIFCREMAAAKAAGFLRSATGHRRADHGNLHAQDTCAPTLGKNSRLPSAPCRRR